MVFCLKNYHRAYFSFWWPWGKRLRRDPIPVQRECVQTGFSSGLFCNIQCDIISFKYFITEQIKVSCDEVPNRIFRSSLKRYQYTHSRTQTLKNWFYLEFHYHKIKMNREDEGLWIWSINKFLGETG